MKKRALLTVLLGAVAAVVTRRAKAQRTERELWTEAGQSPEPR